MFDIVKELNISNWDKDKQDLLLSLIDTTIAFCERCENQETCTVGCHIKDYIKQIEKLTDVRWVKVIKLYAFWEAEKEKK